MFHNQVTKALGVIDVVTIWALILIGLALMLGVFSRIALVGGIALVGSFYLSHVPFIGAEYGAPGEGNYLYVDKTLIEIAAMIVLLSIPASQSIGLDRFLSKKARS